MSTTIAAVFAAVQTKITVFDGRNLIHIAQQYFSRFDVGLCGPTTVVRTVLHV